MTKAIIVATLALAATSAGAQMTTTEDYGVSHTRGYTDQGQSYDATTVHGYGTWETRGTLAGQDFSAHGFEPIVPTPPPPVYRDENGYVDPYRH
jgi:hypothetical protein